MCGICGWAASDINRKFNSETLKKMTDAIRHRGPNGEGFFEESGVAFGHRRLSILDIERGGQPFFSPSGRYVLTYNGEVYNAPELRDELIKKGYPFRTHCDTEVIAVLADAYDFKFADMLEGIFAFGLWDRKEKRLLLARDGLGVKPLVYRVDDDGIRFASELKALYADDSLSWTLDSQALHHYLGLNYIPSPFTIYKEARKLYPGEMLVWKMGEAKKSIFWAPKTSPDSSLKSWNIGETLRNYVNQSVKGQLQSDVPLGVFLSAGIDSACVLMSSFEMSDNKPTAFCVGFHERSFDERWGARETSKIVGSNLVEFILEPNLDDLLPKMASHFDEPFADSSAVPVWELCRQSAEQITVALSGEGGDEVFCGYEPYRAHLYADALQKIGLSAFSKPFYSALKMLPASDRKSTNIFKLIRFLPYVNSAIADRHFLWKVISDEAQKANLYKDDWRNENSELLPTIDLWRKKFEEFKSYDPITGAALADLTIYLPGDILPKVDISSMAHSLEVRVPLLDRRIVNYAAGLPDAKKIDFFRKKKPLHDAFKNDKTRSIFNRPKQGFSIPAAKWLKDELKPLFMDAVHSASFKDFPAIKTSQVLKIYSDHEQKKEDLSRTLWGLLMLALWSQSRAK